MPNKSNIEYIWPKETRWVQTHTHTHTHIYIHTDTDLLRRERFEWRFVCGKILKVKVKDVCAYYCVLSLIFLCTSLQTIFCKTLYNQNVYLISFIIKPCSIDFHEKYPCNSSILSTLIHELCDIYKKCSISLIEYLVLGSINTINKAW